MYKNNSDLIAKTKVSKYKKGQCLTEKLVLENPQLFISKTVAFMLIKGQKKIIRIILKFRKI